MSKVKKMVKIALRPLSLVNKIIHKNPKLVLFYSNLGFRDNVRALYEYMLKNKINEHRKIVVATDEYKRFKKCSPQNVKFVSTKRGIISFFRSKFCFYSFGKYPIKPSNEQTVVNLWHGMPLKAVGRLENGHQNDDQNFFSYVIATSPFFADIMKRAFGADDEQIVLTAQPRCDELFEKTKRPASFVGFDKVIFWLPTFMSSKRLNQIDGEYGEINPYSEAFLSSVSKVLLESNTILVIKPHPMDDCFLPEQKIGNVLFVTDDSLEGEGLNLYSTLAFADALVTDFSSIYIDFMQLSRPIAFVDGNSENYSQKRGFAVEDFESLMVGEKIKSAEDFGRFVKSVAQNEDRYKRQRDELNKRFAPQNNEGCKTLLNKINF